MSTLWQFNCFATELLQLLEQLLTYFSIVAVKGLGEVQTLCLFHEDINIFGIYFSCPCWKKLKYGCLKLQCKNCKGKKTKKTTFWTDLLNCMMYLPVTSPFRKVSVHSRQSAQVCRMCPLWSDRFSLKDRSASHLFLWQFVSVEICCDGKV